MDSNINEKSNKVESEYIIIKEPKEIISHSNTNIINRNKNKQDINIFVIER